ncbi:hypothetical protein MWU57_08175 [Isoptericola sp. S6320L]|uniref:hypothetical protein n=1 Tax=Isoptericola sp. S6320L TaxID=2926411 RepID=UPI001FF1768C|nr:hypothetical protein [Isoptericola sp. S6320L]MCK0117011.1 hypothetical protein [Isoptericola sp. S6320L]
METTSGPARLCGNPTCRSPIPASRRSNAKYCSPACASVVSTRNHEARRRGQAEWTPSVPEERACARPGCSDTVSVERARHGGRYCSDRCARAARRERSAAHAKRSRALTRRRAAARRDRALASRLETLSQDATARIRELEAGEAAIARQLADVEETAVGHEQNAQQLARWLWHLAAVYGDRLVVDERVQTLLRHYLPELAGPTGDHQHADDAGAPPSAPRSGGW